MQYNKRWTMLFLLLALALAAPLTTIAATANSPATIALSKKRVDKTTAYVGDELVYTIVLDNSGNDPMDVTMTDPLPLQVDYITHTVGIIVPTGGGTGSGTWQSPSLFWSGTLDAGSAVTLTLTAKVNNMAVVGENIVNEATICPGGTPCLTFNATTAVWAKLFMPFVANQYATP